MSVIIIDALGNIIEKKDEIKDEILHKLEQMHDTFNKENQKIDIQKIGKKELYIYRSEIDTQITVHTHGKRPNDTRNTEYYFLYRTDETGNLKDILKHFLKAANEESINKYEIEIKNIKESLFIFRDIEKIANDKISPDDKEDLISATCKFIDQGNSPQFESGSIEKILSFILHLEEKRKILEYSIYVSTNIRIPEKSGTVNFFINREKSIEIEPSGKFKEFFKEYNLNNIFNNFVSAFDSVIGSWNKLNNELKKTIFKIIYTNIKDFKNVLNDLIKWSESGKSGKYSNKLTLKDVSFLEKNQMNEEILSNYRNMIEIWENINFEGQKYISKNIISKVEKFCTELESFNKKSETIPEKINSQQDSNLTKPIILDIDAVFTEIFDIWEKLDSKQKESIVEKFNKKITQLNDIYNRNVKPEPFSKNIKKQGFVSWKTAGVITGIGIIFALIAFYKYLGFPYIEQIYVKYILIFLLVIALIILLHFLIKNILPEQNQNSDHTADKPAIEFSNKKAIAEGTATNKIINSIDMELFFIPPGEFDMGSNNNEKKRDSNEGPQHRVKISTAFYISEYEVTLKQWQNIMKSNPSSMQGDFYDDHPVEQISWNDVQEFIRKLNEKEQTNKYRLPSEAEWEYAARAGTKTGYYFGDDESKLGDYAWYAENSGSRPPKKGNNNSGYDEKDWLENNWVGIVHPVGRKKANPWGLYDMNGNVKEWVQDKWHENYNNAPTDGSSWESGEGFFRVLRGGSWASGAGSCRSAAREYYDQKERYHLIGFRLVKEK